MRGFEMTWMDYGAIALLSALWFAAGWHFGSASGYARGVKWGSDFEKRVR